ncbi:hypothetical protein RI054_23g98700 [Pseudoscourfieldia marina]
MWPSTSYNFVMTTHAAPKPTPPPPQDAVQAAPLPARVAASSVVLPPVHQSPRGHASSTKAATTTTTTTAKQQESSHNTNQNRPQSRPHAGLSTDTVLSPRSLASPGVRGRRRYHERLVAQMSGEAAAEAVKMARVQVVAATAPRERKGYRSRMMSGVVVAGEARVVQGHASPSTATATATFVQTTQEGANNGGGRDDDDDDYANESLKMPIAQSIATYTASLAATKPSQRIILPTSGVSIGVQAAPTGWTRYYFDDKQIQRAVQPRSFGGMGADEIVDAPDEKQRRMQQHQQPLPSTAAGPWLYMHFDVRVLQPDELMWSPLLPVRVESTRTDPHRPLMSLAVSNPPDFIQELYDRVHIASLDGHLGMHTAAGGWAEAPEGMRSRAVWEHHREMGTVPPLAGRDESEIVRMDLFRLCTYVSQLAPRAREDAVSLVRLQGGLLRVLMDGLRDVDATCKEQRQELQNEIEEHKKAAEAQELEIKRLTYENQNVEAVKKSVIESQSMDNKLVVRDLEKSFGRERQEFKRELNKLLNKQAKERDKYNAVTAELEVWKQRFEAERIRSQDLESEVASRDETIAELRAQLKDSKNVAMQLRVSLKSMQLSYDGQMQKNGSMDSVNQNQKNQISHLGEMLKKAHKELELEREERTRLSLKASQSYQDAIDADNRAAKSLEEEEERRKQMEEQTLLIEEIKQRSAVLEAELERLRAEAQASAEALAQQAATIAEQASDQVVVRIEVNANPELEAALAGTKQMLLNAEANADEEVLQQRDKYLAENQTLQASLEELRSHADTRIGASGSGVDTGPCFLANAAILFQRMYACATSARGGDPYIGELIHQASAMPKDVHPNILLWKPTGRTATFKLDNGVEEQLAAPMCVYARKDQGCLGAVVERFEDSPALITAYTSGNLTACKNAEGDDVIFIPIVVEVSEKDEEGGKLPIVCAIIATGLENVGAQSIDFKHAIESIDANKMRWLNEFVELYKEAAKSTRSSQQEAILQSEAAKHIEAVSQSADSSQSTDATHGTEVSQSADSSQDDVQLSQEPPRFDTCVLEAVHNQMWIDVQLRRFQSSSILDDALKEMRGYKKAPESVIRTVCSLFMLLEPRDHSLFQNLPDESDVYVEDAGTTVVPHAWMDAPTQQQIVWSSIVNRLRKLGRRPASSLLQKYENLHCPAEVDEGNPYYPIAYRSLRSIRNLIRNLRREDLEAASKALTVLINFLQAHLQKDNLRSKVKAVIEEKQQAPEHQKEYDNSTITEATGAIISQATSFVKSEQGDDSTKATSPEYQQAKERMAHEGIGNSGEVFPKKKKGKR